MTSPRKMIQYAKSIHGCRQELMVDSGAFKQLAGKMIEQGRQRVVLISGKQTRKLKLYDRFVEELQDGGAKCFVFAFENNEMDRSDIRRCAALCLNNNCDAIVAFGGGSIIDVAKLVAAWVNNPYHSLYQMRGIGQIKNAGLPLYVVSTTGSGAESSACSMIRNNHQIYMYYSRHLIPGTVVLDPDLMLRLPMENMAQAMILALAHAVEAYISPASPEYQGDRANVLIAVPIFFSYLEQCYKHGGNTDTYIQMMMAPYYAGVSTRRIGFGYAHCLSMYIADKYHVSPGQACAAILPAVLEFEFQEAKSKLAELARAAHLCSAHASEDDAAKAFISGFRSLCRRVNLPDSLPQIQPEACGEEIENALIDAEQWKHPKKINEKFAVTILRKAQKAEEQ